MPFRLSTARTSRVPEPWSCIGLRRQQVCGKGAEIAIATGTNVPASSNTSNSLAVRRYMTGTEPNLSPPKDKVRGPRAQAFAGYGSVEGLSGTCHPVSNRLRAASKTRDPHLTAESCACRGAWAARLLSEAQAPPLRMTMTLTRQRPTSAATVCPFAPESGVPNKNPSVNRSQHNHDQAQSRQLPEHTETSRRGSRLIRQRPGKA